MALSYISKVLEKGKYWGWLLIPAGIVFILYTAIFADPGAFGAEGPWHLIFNWGFAMLMPLLMGLVIAVQAFNQCERKTCPASGTASGLFGSFIGISTVACPMCPAVLLGWLGLGAAIPSAILSSLWLKSLSLVLLMVALMFATKGQK